MREIAVPPARMSAAAARFLGDVFLREQDGFVEVGVEIRLHPRAVRLFRPFDEVFDGSLGTVGIVDFQAAAHRREFVADGLQCFRRLDREHGRRAFVAADAVPGEIVRGIVPDFRDCVRRGFGEMHESGRRAVTSVGAFFDATTERIFEEEGKGMLASL